MSESIGARTKKLAITVAYDVIKTLSGVDRPFDPSAEFMHGYSKNSDWNESYYFNFFDAAKDIGGWTRIGFLPNQELDHGVMVVYWKDRRTMAYFERKKGSASGGELALGDLEYVCLEPAKAWKIALRGDLFEIETGDVIGMAQPEPRELRQAELELTFEGISPPVDIRSIDSGLLAGMLVESGATISDARKSRKVSHRHYEQVGEVTGKLCIDGDEITFEGGGHRDHSWGVRDWSVPNYWNFTTCQFGDEMAFNLSRVSLGNTVLRFGFVVEGGTNHPIRESAIEVSEDDDQGPQQVALSMAYSDGKTAAVRGAVIQVTPIVFETNAGKTLINEALTRYQWRDKVGLGIFEILSSDFVPG